MIASKSPRASKTIVVGGGLAGLAVACDLADSSHVVTVLESRPRAGGRVCSYADADTACEVDNGQHVFLACCTELTAFLERIGASDRARVQSRLDIPFLHPVEGRGSLTASFLPWPLHMSASFATFPFLDGREKFGIARGLAEIARVGDRRRALSGVTFSAWLGKMNQGPRAVRRFWNLLILPTLNAPVDKVDASTAMMVFQEAMLRSERGGNLGIPTAPLSRMAAEPASAYLMPRGGHVRLRAPVDRLLVEGGRAAGVRLVGGEILRADHVVLAVPWNRLPALLPDELRNDNFFRKAEGLRPGAIVGIHLWFDRAVWSGEFAALLDVFPQWVFNKGRLLGLPEWDGRWLSVVQSGADAESTVDADLLVETSVADLRRLFPAAAAANLIHRRVIKEREATFIPAPDADRHRLPQKTPVPGLTLAGAWTQTGWPATMEGAVRSGRLAAKSVLEADGSAC